MYHRKNLQKPHQWLYLQSTSFVRKRPLFWKATVAIFHQLKNICWNTECILPFVKQCAYHFWHPTIIAHQTSPLHHLFTLATYVYFVYIFTRFENNSSHHHQHKIPHPLFLSTLATTTTTSTKEIQIELESMITSEIFAHNNWKHRYHHYRSAWRRRRSA